MQVQRGLSLFVLYMVKTWRFSEPCRSFRDDADAVLPNIITILLTNKYYYKKRWNISNQNIWIKLIQWAAINTQNTKNKNINLLIALKMGGGGVNKFLAHHYGTRKISKDWSHRLKDWHYHRVRATLLHLCHKVCCVYHVGELLLGLFVWSRQPTST